MTVPQVCACSVAAPRAQLGALPSPAAPRRFALSLPRYRLWLAPVLWWQHIELPRRRVDVTPDLALQWRFAPAPCLAVRPGLQCLWFCVGGFLSPANELDAAGALGQGRCSACRQWCSYSFARVNVRGFDLSRIGVCDHACKPKTVKVSGTAKGNRSGYDFLIIALFSWITLSWHDTHIRKEDQDREEDLEVARGPMVAVVSLRCACNGCLSYLYFFVLECT